MRNASLTSDMAGRHMSKRNFMQPLAVALVSLVFTLLFFSMARVDLRQLEGVIHDMLKQKAFFVVEGIEAASQIRYDRILKSGAIIDGFQPGLPADDETFAIQDTLVKALVDLARDVDTQAQKLPLISDELKTLAASEHLQAVIILDKNGDVAFQSSPDSLQMSSLAKDLVSGRREAVIHLFGGISESGANGAADFVGIRRQEGNGAVLLVLDKNSIQYWAMKISTRTAIENSPMGRGIVYLAAEDAGERLLTQTGSVPSEKVSECLLLAGSARELDNPVSACVKFGDIKFLEVFLPFKLDGHVVGKIRVGLETQETDAMLQEKSRHIFLWTGLMMAIGILVLGVLYQTQNRHISRLQAVQENLYHAERLSSLAKLGARVAHEVRKPLNAISMAAQRLQREFAPAESGKNQEEFGYITRIVRDEIQRINTIVEDFLSLSRSNRLNLRQASIAAVLERVHFLVREEVQARGIRVEIQGLENNRLMVMMDVHKMEQALLNIVRNAADAISGEGAITLVLEIYKKDFIRIRVRDTGAGIAANETGHIFDPDYTTKSNGTGLGLSIANEFVAVNCAAIPETLIESEFFGHEKGAFTGAFQRRIGRFEQADGGTLFLDEIGELSPAVQVKLLRFLQEREFQRVGGEKTVKADVRIISATHQDLETRVKDGTFREDIFYRIHVVTLKIPPLKERREDIPVLMTHFIRRFGEANRKKIDGVSREAQDLLVKYDYPGNVRELENIIERAIVIARGSVISTEDLPFQNPICKPGEAGISQTPVGNLHQAIAEMERKMIEDAMRQAEFNQSKAALLLGLGERMLRYKLKKYPTVQRKCMMGIFPPTEKKVKLLHFLTRQAVQQKMMEQKSSRLILKPS